MDGIDVRGSIRWTRFIKRERLVGRSTYLYGETGR